MLAVPASRVASSPAPVRRIARTRRRAISTRARAAVSGTDAGLPSLTDASTWRLRFDLYSGKDPSATTPDRVVAVDVKFVVDEGYEPPQGVLQIVDDPEGILVADGRHRWTLEEVRGSNPGDDDRDPASVCAFRLDDSVACPLTASRRLSPLRRFATGPERAQGWALDLGFIRGAAVSVSAADTRGEPRGGGGGRVPRAGGAAPGRDAARAGE